MQFVALPVPYTQRKDHFIASPVLDIAIMEEEREKKGEAIEEARFEFYNTLGNASPLVIAPMINPMFLGGPNWPTRPSWKSIQLPQNGIVWATNGLADPWSNPEMFADVEGIEDFNLDTGIGLELVCGSKDIGSDAIRDAVVSVSHVLAGNPFILNMLQRLKEQCETLLGDFYSKHGSYLSAPFSTTTKAPPFPELQLENGKEAGVLIDQGLSADPSFDTPHGTVQVLEIVILFPHELEWILKLGDPARVEISRRLHARQEPWPSSPKRRPCVDPTCPIPDEPVEDFDEGIRIIRETWNDDNASSSPGNAGSQGPSSD